MTLWTRIKRVARSQLGLELDDAALRPLEDFFVAQRFDRQAREAFVSALEGKGSTSKAFDTMTRRVTNGQTYFMRHPAQLASIEAFLDRHPARRSRPLHVWCAGCSTGEEAYTISMLGRRANVPMCILATDINLESLARARQGVYGDWALRYVDASERDACFAKTPSGFCVNELVRAQTSFERHNLAVDAARLSADPSGKWDLVICRNVLIYFAADTRSRVISGFESVLAPQGVLMLSASETIRGAGTGLQPSYLAGTYVLSPTSHRPLLAEVRMASLAPPHLTERERPLPLPSTLARSRARAAAKYWLDLGNDWLRQHDFDQALYAYLQANRLDGTSFEPYLLIAIVHIKRGDLGEAKTALRSALFLESRAWSAEYLLAGVYARERNARASSLALDRAILLLETGRAILAHHADCSGVDPLCYTLEEAQAACLTRRATGPEKVRR